MTSLDSYRGKYAYLEDRELSAIENFFNRPDILAMTDRLEARRKRTIRSILALFGICVLAPAILGALAIPFAVAGFFLVIWLAKKLAQRSPAIARTIGWWEESVKETLLPAFVKEMGANFRYASSPAGFEQYRRMNPDIRTDERGLLVEDQSPEVLEINGNIADATDSIIREAGLLEKTYANVFAEDSVQQYVPTPDIGDAERGGIMIESVEIETRGGQVEVSGMPIGRGGVPVEHCYLTKIRLNNPRFSFGEEGVYVESRRRKRSVTLAILGLIVLFLWVFLAGAVVLGYREDTASGKEAFARQIIPIEIGFMDTAYARSRSSIGGSRSSGFHSSSSSLPSVLPYGISSSLSSDSDSRPATPLEMLVGGMAISLLPIVLGSALFLRGLGIRLSKIGKTRRIGGKKYAQVTTDNAEFAKRYKVFAQNPTLAMKILTNDFTWRVVDFSKKLGKDATYAFFFREDTVWVKYDLLLSGVKDFMEFSMYKNLQKNIASYLEFFLEVKAVTNLARELNVFRLDAGVMRADSLRDRLANG